MIDVHPPHEPLHGWRDFLLHLLTITIGLLIALGLEGCVEWQHHRHLVHEAQASLLSEIKSNEQSIPQVLADIHAQQEDLTHDMDVLNEVVKSGKLPQHSQLSIGFRLISLGDVSWRTAQTTGVLSYMSYAQAQSYSDIYDAQQLYESAARQAVRDAILALAPFSNSAIKDPDRQQASVVLDRIETLQGQLFLLDSVTKSLDQEYRKFLSSHS
jgi:hypothetical protein